MTELNLGDSAGGQGQNQHGGDALGSSVALSAGGTTALVGAPSRTVDGYLGAGAAEVFHLSGSVWGAPVELSLGTAARTNGAFGESLALSGDGKTALILAREDNPPSAYVFTFAGGTWSAPTPLDLDSNNPSAGTPWMDQVALSGDGRTAMVGSDVFRFDGTSWSDPVQLGLSPATSASLSTDGNTAILGVPPSLKVFRFAGGQWSQQKSLAPGPKARAAGDSIFGNTIALSGDGNSALSGVSSIADFFGFKGNAWAAPVEIGPYHGVSLGDSGSHGPPVALSADGDTALFAYPSLHLSGGNFIGGAEVYRFDGTSWSQMMGINLPNGAGSNFFGSSVALSADGTTALVGIPGQTVHDSADAGAAEIFVADPTAVAVTINAAGPHGAKPGLGSGMAPSDPRIGYTPPGEAVNVTGSLSCGTGASSAGKSEAGIYSIHSCRGLSDPGHTIVYDYVNSSYVVTLAPVKLRYTGPKTLTSGVKAKLSVKMTSAVNGLPIKDRTVKMQIDGSSTPGDGIQTCMTDKTNAAGSASCTIKRVSSTVSPNVVTMRFSGDKRGSVAVPRNYDFAAGQGTAAITIQ